MAKVKLRCIVGCPVLKNSCQEKGLLRILGNTLKTRNQELAIVNCVCNYIVILVSVIFQFGFVGIN